jgi:hypothetical protein
MSVTLGGYMQNRIIKVKYGGNMRNLPLDTINHYKLNQMTEQLKQLFKGQHVFNLSAIERKAGIRKLKLHEFVNGKAELSHSECMKINKIVENATKLQK